MTTKTEALNVAKGGHIKYSSNVLSYSLCVFKTLCLKLIPCIAYAIAMVQPNH